MTLQQFINEGYLATVLLVISGILCYINMRMFKNTKKSFKR